MSFKRKKKDFAKWGELDGKKTQTAEKNQERKKCVFLT